MKPFYCRIGSKMYLVKLLKQYVPTHQTYIEPFVGGGSLFFGLSDEEIGKEKIINDLDSYLIEGYEILKDAPTHGYEIPFSLEDKQKLVDRKAKNKNEELLQHLFMTCNTFGSKCKGKLKKNTQNKVKIENIPLYKERLKNTKIENTYYDEIIKKYDNEDAFIFLDPPYEISTDLYKNETIDYHEMNKLLKNIKGKFLLTINDSKNIRTIFDGFYIKPIIVRGQTTLKSSFGATNRNELIITNYPLNKL